MNRRIQQGIGDFIRNLIEMIHRRKAVLISLSCVVVFLTTYLLILPAFTLDKDEAIEQGGIDVTTASEGTTVTDAAPEVKESVSAEEIAEPGADTAAPESSAVTEESGDATEQAQPESSGAQEAAVAETSEESQMTSEPANTEGTAKADASKTTETEEKAPAAGNLLFEGDNYKVSIDDTQSVLPEAANIQVEEIDKDKEEYAKQYEELYKEALTAVQEEKGGDKVADFSFAKFYDISLLDGDETIEPDSAVDVKIEFDKELQKELKAEDTNRVRVLHFNEDKKTGEVTPAVLENKDVEVNTDNKDKITDTTFKAEGFSVYAVVYTVEIQKDILTSSGDKYKVTVSYGEDARIPEGAELKVEEITDDNKKYSSICESVDAKLQETGSEMTKPVLLDISIIANGEEIEPAEGSKVKVDVQLDNTSLEGRFTKEDAPLLINDQPVTEEHAKVEQSVQVLHQKQDGEIETMETKDEFGENAVTASFSTESFSNWLVYLDEDLTDINVTTSDSLTLRPYSEWVWKKTDEPEAYQGGQWTFPSSDWNVSYQREWVNNQWVNNYYTIYTHKTNGSVFRSFSKEDTQLNETYTVVTSVSLNAGNFDIQTNKGKTIHVHVTQGSSSPKPDTVAGIPGLTVNLFDYDVPTKNGQYDFTQSGNLDVSGNKATSVINETVNIGHNLKFLGWGYDGDGYGVNSYTKDVPKQGIVKDSLNDKGYPVLNDGSNQNLDYLFKTSSHDSSVYAFANAGGLFQQDNQGFYYYNSNSNYAEYDRNTNQFVLYEHTYSQNTGGSNGSNAKPIGFFPFHEYDTDTQIEEMNHNKYLNHHFGMSMSVDFQIPKDRQAEDESGNKHDIIYEFSGDDDLWVFVDDELVLDIGGLHQPVTGSINFTTGEIKVHGMDDITKTFKVGAHTMKMFYLERGGCDSNLSVKFNLPLVKGKAAIDLAKKSLVSDSTNPDQFLSGAVFGIWENKECSGEPYATATSDSSGHIDFGYLPVEQEGQKFYIKEIAPPSGYLLNMTVFTATAVADGENQFKFRITDENGEIEKVEQEPHYPIVRDGRPDPIDLSVEKKWQNADGSPLEDPSGTAVFKIKRYYYYVEGSAGPANSTINVYRVDQNWNNPSLMESREYAGDTTAYVNWTYNQYYGWSKDGPYRINNGSEQIKGNNPAAILLPAGATTNVYIFDGNMGTQYEQYGVENITVSGTEPSSGSDNITTGEGEDTEYQGPTITLPTSSGAWSDTFRNLVVAEQKGDRTYYYSYYIVEDSCPEGYEAIYVDGNGKPITDPSSLNTNNSGSQTVINRKLMDVPVIKGWEDFSEGEFTWTADFQLEQRELKVNEGDPDAPDAINEWAPVEGKTLRVTKGQNVSFEGLPRFRTHSNGTVYRILYSVAETAYEVKEGDTVVAKWDEEHGHTIGHKYTPQFIQDAGGDEQGEKPYEIKLANTLHKPTVTNTIDLSLEKKWKSGNQDYDPGSDASATFVLKRYVHEEYRDHSHVTDETDMITITLDVGGTGANPTITVPKGSKVSISGNVLAGQNARIEFTRGNGTVLSKQIDNSSSQSLKPFEISFEATQNETVKLSRGDNYVSGGREGFRLTDHGDQSAPKIDKHFEQEFTLPVDGNWKKQFENLTQIEEDEMDETSRVQTITVYTYYFEEKSCTPEGFDPVFKTENGQILGDAGNPIDVSHEITAENQAGKGALNIVKNVTVDGKPVTNANKKYADGTYSFTVEGKSGPAAAYGKKTYTITITDGAAQTVTVPDLPYGEYEITEIDPTNGTTVVGDKSVTVNVAAGTTGATTTAIGNFTNNMETVDVTVHKVWHDNNNKDGKRPDSLKVTLSNGQEVTLNDGNNWTASITGLPKYDHDGKVIEYTWTEETIGNGYVMIDSETEEITEAGHVTQATTITNGPDEHYNPLTTFTGSKTWKDDGSNRPGSITIKLYKGTGASKELVEERVLEAPEDGSNVWNYEFTNLPVFDDQGIAIEYSVEEVLPDGYVLSRNQETSHGISYERDPDNDGVFVNEPNRVMTISTGHNLGFIVIMHGHDFIIWTPRKASSAELNLIKEMVGGEATRIGNQQFSQILYRDVTNVYGVPNSVGKNNMKASIIMDGDEVVVDFGNKNWSSVAWGTLAYTYTPGNADLINTQKFTDFEFGKRWIGDTSEETEWDQSVDSIQVTLERKCGNQKDDSFALVYTITPDDIVHGKNITPDSADEDAPKIKVSVTETEGKKQYKFMIEGLEYADENSTAYTYYVTETNDQLEGYIEPRYENTSAPTGTDEAYNEGTIINTKENGVELPHTGGIGTAVIYLAGAALVAVSVMLLARRRKALH